MEKEKKKLKILIFNRWVGYNEGGNETHIKELAVELSKKGHEIDMLTTGEDALSDIRDKINDVIQINTPKEYFTYNKKKFIFSIKYIIDSFVIFDRLLRKEKRQYDLVTVHFSIESFIMRFIRAIYKIPYVLILVGDTDLELIEGKRANNVSQLTRYMANECKPYGYYPKILTKGVDRTRFNINVDGTEVRKKYIKREDQFLVLTVCRLDPRKNLETLITAANILKKKHSDNYKFVIVGGGVEEDKLKGLSKKLGLEDDVFFTGMLKSTSDILPKYYAAADLFALPTLHEGFGYVFSEAMAFGLPVIGTDVSAVPEVIESAGILIPIKSPEKLAEAILSVYESKDLRDSLSQKSINSVEKWYWDVLIQDYLNFIYDGVDNFSTRSNIFIRYITLTLNLLLDIPKLIFIGIFPILVKSDHWGSIFRKS